MKTFKTKKEAEAYQRLYGGNLVWEANAANRSGRTYKVVKRADYEAHNAKLKAAQAEADEPFKMQYLVGARFRKDEKFHTVAGTPAKPLKDLETARRELQAIKAKAEREIKNKRRTPWRFGKDGFATVETEYISDYDLVEFKIIARKATPWKTIEVVKGE